MTEVEVRQECPLYALNRRKGNSCTEDDFCSACWMDKDVEENSEMYMRQHQIDLLEAIADELDVDYEPLPWEV